MAVTIDCRIDERVLAEDRQQDPCAADPAIIETTYFTMPVRFSVDETELLRIGPSDWLPQPVLGFATHLRLSVDTLRATGSATCSVAGAGTLRFERREERVRLSCSFNKGQADTSVDELDAAVKRFRKRIEGSLRALVPELTGHPSWLFWFPLS